MLRNPVSTFSKQYDKCDIVCMHMGSMCTLLKCSTRSRWRCKQRRIRFPNDVTHLLHVMHCTIIIKHHLTLILHCDALRDSVVVDFVVVGFVVK